MICTLVLPDVYPARWDALVEDVHRHTPLLVVPYPGVLHAGTDNVQGIHALVRRTKALASLAPTRRSGLLTALHGVGGRMDAHDSDAEVPVRTLLRVPQASVTDVQVRRMEMFGLHTIGALTTITSHQLVTQFGTKDLACFLFTADTPLPWYAPPPMCQATVRCMEPAQEPAELEALLDTVVSQATALLERRTTWRIELSVLDAADTVQHCVQRILRCGLSTVHAIRVHGMALMQQLQRTVRRWYGMRLRLLSLRVPVAEQTALMPARVTAQQVAQHMAPKYGSTLRTIVVVDPWTVDADRYARLMPHTGGTP